MIALLFLIFWSIKEKLQIIYHAFTNVCPASEMLEMVISRVKSQKNFQWGEGGGGDMVALIILASKVIAVFNSPPPTFQEFLDLPLGLNI